MLARYRRALNYWMFAVSHPGYVLDTAQKDMHRIRISFYIIATFAAMYAFTALILWRSGRLPMIEPLLTWIPVQEYYFFQMFWTIPWMIILYLACAGFIYIFTAMGGKEAYFEDSLMISAISLAIPFLMFWWIPETFLLPVMGPGSSTAWPELFEIQRKFVFPGIWQIALVTFGMRKLNNTNRLAGLAAGIFCFLMLLVLWYPYMR